MIPVYLTYINFEEPLSDELYQFYLRHLPLAMQVKNGRYRRWQDRHTHLFGKLLLKYMARRYGYGDEVLDQLQYSKYDRPSLVPPAPDFNISHTKAMVACAISDQVRRIGLDIEAYSQIDFSDFGNIHSPQQWAAIKEASNPQQAFFEYWTIKESVIKADGKGLSIPLSEIHIYPDHATQSTQTWYLKRLFIDDTVAACMACDRSDFEVELQALDQAMILNGNLEAAFEKLFR